LFLTLSITSQAVNEKMSEGERSSDDKCVDIIDINTDFFTSLLIKSKWWDFINIRSYYRVEIFVNFWLLQLSHQIFCKYPKLWQVKTYALFFLLRLFSYFQISIVYAIVFQKDRMVSTFLQLTNPNFQTLRHKLTKIDNTELPITTILNCCKYEDSHRKVTSFLLLAQLSHPIFVKKHH